MRRELSRQQVSDWTRIARLPAAWGEALDELGASYRMTRWVAGPADVFLASVRERRYRALVTLLERGGSNADFEALARAESIIERHKRTEAARPAPRVAKRGRKT